MGDTASEKQAINLWGEKVALGPIRRDLLPLYERWMNDFEAIHYLGVQKRPMTAERETAWYDHAATDPTSADFTIYERATPSAYRERRPPRDRLPAWHRHIRDTHRREGLLE